MQKESDAAAAAAAFCVRLSSASLFLPIASSLCDSLSLGLSVRQRARAIPRLLHARLRLLSRGARYLTVKIYGEGKPAPRTVASSGGTRRERNCERNPTLKADESRADRVSESTKFSNEDCDRHASSCTRRIDSIPRPLYIHTRVIITPGVLFIIVEIIGREKKQNEI